MADEARITSILNIRKTSGTKVILEYTSRPGSFQANVTGTKGPVPGAVTATLAGNNIDFAELATPGLTRVMNLDATNRYEIGIWDPDNSKFFPLLEVLPGESYVIRLSRNLQEEFQTGTGTTGLGANRFRIKANGLAVEALIEAFEA